MPRPEPPPVPPPSGWASRWRGWAALAGLVAFLGGSAGAADPAPGGSGGDLTMLSVEELMKLEVTTVARAPQRVSDSPAAVFVITGDDIRRSGFTGIPEALRLAPGLEVAHVDAHDWAISARGFNDIFANKLLVMMDGRSLYTPLFSGVYWDLQDTLMEDVDRIEVIRGPGATMWGANAVNGVINIITKSAQETQGGLITGMGGTGESNGGAVRYGGQLGADTYYRVYTKYDDGNASVLPDGSNAYDGWQMGRAGFRVDSGAAGSNPLTLQGDVYSGRLHEVYTNLLSVSPYTPYLAPETSTVEGGNVLGRWTHTISADSELTLQTYYDRTFRDDPAIVREDRQTLDFDLQHQFAWGERQKIVWGAGYRVSFQDVSDTFRAIVGPGHRADQLASAFAQDELTLIEKRLKVTLGSKFEHNDYSGFEVQPSGRLTWTPEERQTVWLAVSRAERTPSEVEVGARLNALPVYPNPGLPFLPPAVTSGFGNPNFASGRTLAYELGYRVQPLDRLAFDLATYYNVYDRQRTIELYPPPTPGDPFSFIHLFPGQPGVPPPNVALTYGNNLYAESYGAEAAATWQLTDQWHWRAAYTFTDVQAHTRPGSTDPGTVYTERIVEGDSPRHQFSLRSSMDLPAQVEWDFTVRYVGGLDEGLGASNPPVPGYVTLDARLGWAPTRRLELSVAGQNLVASRHPERYGDALSNQITDVGRGVYGKMTWRF